MLNRRKSGIFLLFLIFFTQQTPVSAVELEFDSEILKAQGELSKALGLQVRAMTSSANADISPASASIGTAQDQLSQLIHRRHQEETDRIYGKAYLPDGRIMKASEWREDLPAASRAPAGNPGWDMPPSVNGGGKIVHQTGIDRPEWVLDGSQIPKEMIFPGKKKR